MPEEQVIQGEITEDALAPPERSGAAALIQIDKGGLMLKSLEDLMRFARLLVKDGAAPKGMTVGAVAIAVQAGLERGLGISGGLNFGTVINGRFAWNGQGAYALIQNNPACKPGTLRVWLEGDGDERRGVATAGRVGYRDAERREFSVKDAKQARLWGKAGPWQDYPERMLKWRALGLLARDVFPDVLGGFPLSEEAQDFETTPTHRAEIGVGLEKLPTPKVPDPLFDAIEASSSKEVLTQTEEAIAQHIEQETRPTCDHGIDDTQFCQDCSTALDVQAVEAERPKRKKKGQAGFLFGDEKK